MYYEHLVLLQITAEKLINELNWVLLLIESKVNDEKVYERKKKRVDKILGSSQQLVSLKACSFNPFFASFLLF